MSQKMQPCCNKFHVQIINQEGDIRRIARSIMRAEAKGRETSRYRAQLAAAQTNLQETKNLQVDHEADHAADVAAGVPA